MKPSKFVAFLALFSIFFISPLPSNASGVHISMNDTSGTGTMGDLRLVSQISTELQESSIWTRALEVIGAILLILFIISGLWLPLIILVFIVGMVWYAVQYIFTGKTPSEQQQR